MTSAPPAPSIVSLPDPPVMTLAVTDPVIETDEDSVEASTFWKLLTMVASPTVWSTTPRLTVAAVFSASVLLPAPPSSEFSVP